MLWLRDVPEFEWIYLHTGGNDADIEGCIPVGSGVDAGGMTLRGSRNAYQKLYTAVAQAAADDELEITILDRDGG